MKDRLEKLIAEAQKNNATDIHFTIREQQVSIAMRTIRGFVDIECHDYDLSLFNYIKYQANLDLGNLSVPQSGNFEMMINGRRLYFRFSMLATLQVQTAVLRLLNNHEIITIDDLSVRRDQTRTFYNWTHLRSGMILITGPTGSGKTTTLNAILEAIALNKQLKVITLEDPIEIVSPNYLQLQINERLNLTYEEGIKQLLRHDPDVVMIGEIRDAETAKMAFRCALSGHLVFSTMHCKCASEAIKRLCEFGLEKHELLDTLSAITNQRLFVSKKRKGRICLYEILEKQALRKWIEEDQPTAGHIDIFKEIRRASEEGIIYKKDAKADLYDFDESVCTISQSA